MTKQKTLAAAALLVAGAASIGSAEAGTGLCTLNALTATGSYGFNAQGVATNANAFGIPVGNFTQVGVVTQANEVYYGRTLNGTFSVVESQLDMSGYKPNLTFSGTSVIDTTTCMGDFTVNVVNGTAVPPTLAFKVTLVNNGDGLRTIAVVPGIFVAYTSAQKL